VPRNGSGVFSRLAGTTAVSGATIASAPYNNVIDDLVADANVPRPIVAGGTAATTAAGALANLGLTATATELNYVDGVTSAIQTQLNAKPPLPKIATGVGEWRSFSVAGTLVSLVLPAGGTWAYVCWKSVAGAADSFIGVGVQAGGTTVLGPDTGTLLGFCWRIA
jgi:hypothetical protein